MATILAQATGNWSAAGTWAGGVLPGFGGATDDADANGFGVTIDQDVNLNGGALINTNAGAGTFTASTARTITANITATVRTLLTCSHASGTTTITGNITGGTTSISGVNFTGAGTLVVIGNVVGGAGTNARGITTGVSHGPLTITGNLTGGAGGQAVTVNNAVAVSITGNLLAGSNSGYALQIAAIAANVTVTGSVTGGTTGSTYGISSLATSGTIAIIGSVTGGSNTSGYGIHNGSTGTMSITGSAIAGSAAIGAYNGSTGTLTVGRAVGSGAIAGLYGAVSGGQTAAYEFESGSLGTMPAGGYVKIIPDTTRNVFVMRKSTDGTPLSLIVAPTAETVASQVRTELAVELARIDATISSRATQTSVDDLPTNAELTTALGTADDAVLAAIAALNNLSSAGAQAAAAAALTAYGVATATGVWAASSRTLTQTAAQVAAVMAGSTLTIQRGDTLTITLTGLGSLATRSKLWFTAKHSTGDSDDDARLFIEETAGLTRLNGAAYTTTTDGDITVDGEAAGDITITVKAAATAALSDQQTLVYDVQILRADGTVATLTSGTAIVVADVTRAVT